MSPFVVLEVSVCECVSANVWVRDAPSGMGLLSCLYALSVCHCYGCKVSMGGKKKNYHKMYITGSITPMAVEKLQNKQHSEHHFLIGACLTFTFNNRFYDTH